MCVRRCSESAAPWRKAWPQSPHWKGFSPVRIFWCSTWEDTWPKDAPHLGHSLIGPGARVQQAVLRQVQAVAEGAVAVLAGEGPLARVHTPVLAQVRELCVKVLPHCAQAKGLSPVWRRRCSARVALWLKDAPHSAHR